jgi:hypothetical protein
MRRPGVDEWIEIASVVLLFLATTGSAWCAYQTVVWTGKANTYIAEVDKAGVDYLNASNIGNLMTAIDVNLFVQYYAARERGDTKMADELLRRFRPQLKQAVEAWLATRPFENPQAPSGPFVMRQYWEYPSEERRRLESIGAEKARLLDETRKADDFTARYGLMSAIFTPLIFIGGVIPKFSLRAAKVFILLFAAVILLFSAGRLFTLPVAH